MQFQDYANNTIEFEGCPACEYVSHKFSLPCGVAYEDNICIVSQDWELPVNGFMVVTPKRHVELFEELTKAERNHLFKIANQVISIMRNNGVAKNFNMVFEEKNGVHFHIWIYPRDGWKEIGIDPTKDIRKLQQHAKDNLKTKENITTIQKTSTLISKEMNKSCK